jgi:hypothetical protein
MAPNTAKTVGCRPRQSPAFAATLQERRRGDPQFHFLRDGRTAAGRYFAARLGFERQQLACLPRAAAAAGPGESTAAVHAAVGEMMWNVRELSALGVLLAIGGRVIILDAPLLYFMWKNTNEI